MLGVASSKSWAQTTWRTVPAALAWGWCAGLQVGGLAGGLGGLDGRHAAGQRPLLLRTSGLILGLQTALN